MAEKASKSRESHHRSHRRGPQLMAPAPPFQGLAVVDGEVKEIKLSDYRGKYLVLFFYPLNFTFVCPTEIIAFSDNKESFSKENCELVACSCDSHFSHLAFINTPRKAGGLESLSFPLLSDSSKSISRDYNVLQTEEGVALRALFIIDVKGNVRNMTIHDTSVGRSIPETLRLLQAIKHHDQTGKHCPHAWQPTDAMLQEEPKKKATFSDEKDK